MSVLPPGEGERRPRVLVIPGLNGAPELLTRAAPRLFPGMQVLPFDHSLDLAEGGVDGLADRALAVLDADSGGAEPAYVCGESFGGTVALTLARRNPERVRGLLLLCAFGYYPRGHARRGRLGLAAWRLLGDRVAAGVFRVSRPFRIPGTLGLRFTREQFWAYLRYSDGYPPAYRRKCEASLHFDARPWLASLTCPTFILTGTWDPVVPSSAGAELAHLIPRARLHRLPGGHVVYLVRAAEVGRLVAGWIAETSAPAPQQVASSLRG
jgi:pimeloyl-ACP methyl ester carboxylesterase